MSAETTFQLPDFVTSYTFQEAEKELNELAVIPALGSVHARGADFRFYAQHREALCNAVFSKLGIPRELWGTAVESRYLHVHKAKKPWVITVGTMDDSPRSNQVAKDLFGPGGINTIVMRVHYEACTDEKSTEYEWQSVEVEVGVFGKWSRFRTIAGQGFRVLAGGSPVTGYVLTARIRSAEKSAGEKAYDYTREQWQLFAAVCVRQHVAGAIMTSVPEADRAAAWAKIKIEPLSQHALYPLRTQVREQSASGIEVHTLISGVLFESADTDEAGGLGLVRCPPLPMMGELPSGRLSEEGKKPLTCKSQMYFSMRDLEGKPKTRGGFFYCPAALETVPGSDGWEEVRSRATDRRTQQRKAVKAERKAARGDSDREYYSDGGGSTASSMRKLARTADAQLSLRPQGGGAPWGTAWGDRGSSSR